MCCLMLLKIHREYISYYYYYYVYYYSYYNYYNYYYQSLAHWLTDLADSQTH